MMSPDPAFPNRIPQAVILTEGKDLLAAASAARQRRFEPAVPFPRSRRPPCLPSRRGTHFAIAARTDSPGLPYWELSLGRAVIALRGPEGGAGHRSLRCDRTRAGQIRRKKMQTSPKQGGCE